LLKPSSRLFGRCLDRRGVDALLDFGVAWLASLAALLALPMPVTETSGTSGPAVSPVSVAMPESG